MSQKLASLVIMFISFGCGVLVSLFYVSYHSPSFREFDLYIPPKYKLVIMPALHGGWIVGSIKPSMVNKKVRWTSDLVDFKDKVDENLVTIYRLDDYHSTELIYSVDTPNELVIWQDKFYGQPMVKWARDGIKSGKASTYKISDNLGTYVNAFMVGLLTSFFILLALLSLSIVWYKYQDIKTRAEPL